MKKKIFTILIGMFLMVLPLKVMALKYNGVDYKTLNLDEALTQEVIEHDFSNYKENNSQAIIYLFRGNGCGYCRNLLNHLNELVKEGKGKYFKVVSFEVWNDTNNSELYKEVAEFLGEEDDGVPFYVIGNKAFSQGYAESLDDEIENAIMEQYNSKNKYDVFEEMKKAKKEETSGTTSNSSVILWTLAFVLIGTVITLGGNYFMYCKISDRLDNIEEKIKLKK